MQPNEKSRFLKNLRRRADNSYDVPSNIDSLKDCRVSVDGGSMKCNIENDAACIIIPARALSITFGYDESYWSLVGYPQHSILHEAYELKTVPRFKVEGECDCYLLTPSVDYRVSFRIKFKDEAKQWSSPVKFSLSPPLGSVSKRTESCITFRHVIEENARKTEKNKNNYRITDGDWYEFDAGTFKAPSYCTYKQKFRFSMEDEKVNSSGFKGGIYLEGVKIYHI